ncbi:MAG: hypothetical protein F6K34_27750 [Okeania sp. SIO4D6]|nr:hypothetical protein [Okeania sp. SIO4D6]
MVNTFLTTFIPSPCLPAVISTAINVSKVSRGYLGVAQAFWQCSGKTQNVNAGKQGLGMKVVKKVLTIEHNTIVQKNPNAGNKTNSGVTKRQMRFHTAC